MTIKTSTIWRFISYWTWGIFPDSHVRNSGSVYTSFLLRVGLVGPLGRKGRGIRQRWPCFILQLSAWKWRIPKGNVKVRRADGRGSRHVEGGGPVNGRTGPARRRGYIFEVTQNFWWPSNKNVVFFSTQTKNHVNWCFNPMWKIPMTSFFAAGNWFSNSSRLGQMIQVDPSRVSTFFIRWNRAFFNETPIGRMKLDVWSDRWPSLLQLLHFGVGNVMPTVKAPERQLNLIWWSICKNLDSNFPWKEEWSKNMAVVPRVV